MNNLLLDIAVDNKAIITVVEGTVIKDTTTKDTAIKDTTKNTTTKDTTITNIRDMQQDFVSKRVEAKVVVKLEDIDFTTKDNAIKASEVIEANALIPKQVVALELVLQMKNSLDYCKVELESSRCDSN